MQFSGNDFLTVTSTGGEGSKFPAGFFGVDGGSVDWVPSLVNDVEELRFLADAAEYDITIPIQPGPSCGIIVLEVNGVNIATFDAYNAAWTNQHVVTDAGRMLIAGINVIRLTVNAKNGASTGFFAPIGIVTVVKV